MTTRIRIMAACAAFTLFALSALSNSGRADEPKRDPATVAERVAAIKAQIDAAYSGLTETYTHFHTHPELSYQQALTSARLAKTSTELGFHVTANVGGDG